MASRGAGAVAGGCSGGGGGACNPSPSDVQAAGLAPSGDTMEVEVSVVVSRADPVAIAGGLTGAAAAATAFDAPATTSSSAAAAAAAASAPAAAAAASAPAAAAAASAPAVSAAAASSAAHAAGDNTQSKRSFGTQSESLLDAVAVASAAELPQLLEVLRRRAVELRRQSAELSQAHDNDSGAQRKRARLGSRDHPHDLEPAAGAAPLRLEELHTADLLQYLCQYRLGLQHAVTPAARKVLLRCNKRAPLVRQSREEETLCVPPLSPPEAGWPQEVVARINVQLPRIRDWLAGEGALGDGDGAVVPCAIRDANDPVRKAVGASALAFGAFAARRLEPHALLDALLIYKGTVKTMGEYEEEVIRDVANETGHLYTIDPSHGDLGEKLTVDASAKRNCAALINDYRGRDPPGEANVRVVECYVDGELVMLLDNVKPLEEGEQLLLDYGEAFWEFFPTIQRRAESIRRRIVMERSEAAACAVAAVKLQLPPPP